MKPGYSLQCSVEGCDRLVGSRGARGWCPRHLQRWQRTGSPTGSSKPTDETRFFRKVRQAGDCWEWIACRDQSGYGMFSNSAGLGRKWTERAHRWSYTFLRAPIPEGLELDHLCRNRSCVNPWHLEPVTPQVNAERGFSIWAVNGRKQACKRGHPFTPDNTYTNPAGSRVCRKCAAAYRSAWEQRQTERRKAA